VRCLTTLAVTLFGQVNAFMNFSRLHLLHLAFKAARLLIVSALQLKRIVNAHAQQLIHDAPKKPAHHVLVAITSSHGLCLQLKQTRRSYSVCFKYDVVAMHALRVHDFFCRCYERHILDVVFECYMEADVAVEECEHQLQDLNMLSVCTQRPLKLLLKPHDFNGGSYTSETVATAAAVTSAAAQAVSIAACC
jgi:hypothetical protein